MEEKNEQIQVPAEGIVFVLEKCLLWCNLEKFRIRQVQERRNNKNQGIWYLVFLVLWI